MPTGANNRLSEQIAVRVPRETMARLRAYASARAISPGRAIVEMLAAQLDGQHAPAAPGIASDL